MPHAKLPLLFLIFLVLSASSYGEKVVEALNEIKVQPSETEVFISICSSLSAMVQGIHEKMAKRLSFLHKDGVAMKSRKLLEADQEVQLDYDYAGPNPRHDPRKGRGGRSL